LKIYRLYWYLLLSNPSSFNSRLQAMKRINYLSFNCQLCLVCPSFAHNIESLTAVNRESRWNCYCAWRARPRARRLVASSLLPQSVRPFVNRNWGFVIVLWLADLRFIDAPPYSGALSGRFSCFGEGPGLFLILDSKASEFEWSEL